MIRHLQLDNEYHQGPASMVYKFFEKTLPLTQEEELFVRINNWLISYTGPLLENLRNAKYTHFF